MLFGATQGFNYWFVENLRCMNEVIERCNSAVSDISQGPLAVEIGEPMAHLEVLADAACLVVPTSEPGGPAAALGAAMVPPHYCPASGAGPSAMVTEIKSPLWRATGRTLTIAPRAHPFRTARCSSTASTPPPEHTAPNLQPRKGL